MAGFLTVPAARIATLVPGSLQKLRALVTHRTPSHHVSTEDNSQANVSHHYDLSNDLFALFLDETLSYSSALFDTSLVETRDLASITAVYYSVTYAGFLVPAILAALAVALPMPLLLAATALAILACVALAARGRRRPPAPALG